MISKLLSLSLSLPCLFVGLQRANRVSPTLSSQWERDLGVGQSWMPLAYGEYYPKSPMIYSAIRVRQDALARVPLKVYRHAPVSSSAMPSPVRGEAFNELSGGPESDTFNPRMSDRTGSVEPVTEAPAARRRAREVGPGHPVQRLLDKPNPFWTRGDLWRATETYLRLWGSAYWGLERDDLGRVIEIWPLRSDRMRVVPDERQYIKGFVYVGKGRRLVNYVPEEVVWLRYFNPLDEYAGLSPIAPLRLSADMSLDALRANRSALANESSPGLFIETEDTPTDEEVKDFYQRWEFRFKGPEKARRPALLSAGMKASNLGFSPREMEYVQSLRWSLEDVSRVYGVPKAMLGDIERITFSNFTTARKVFWEDTIVPQLRFYEEALNQMLMPALGPEASGLFVQFDTSAVEAFQESETDKASRRQKYVAAGIMTVNEVRREMNLPSLPEGD